MRSMRYRIESWDGRLLRMAMPVGEQNLRPGGTVPGPTMMAMADCAAYLLILGLIGPVALAVTTNLNLNFLRKPGLDDQIGRASCRERVCQVVSISVFSGSLTKK